MVEGKKKTKTKNVPEECTKLAYSSVDYADEKCPYEAN